jgi:cyclopropane fatty-acyl-phospholipid synthase-like methyltransferase
MNNEVCLTMNSLKDHWETIYKTKQSNEVSWTQEKPAQSLEFIKKFNLPKTARIIDIGGGDSKLVDFLLIEGYNNLTVLDISEAAILRAKERLSNFTNKVNWIVCDILDFEPTEKYDLWHDRAAFHFQIEKDKIQKYLYIANKAITGKAIIGAFSPEGPQKCSGLDIKQYDEKGMTELFNKYQFENLECKREDHMTPFGTSQNFIFCSFEKRKN